MEKEFIKERYYTLAFYNLENLFDFRDDYKTNDNDFLPTSEKRWNKKRYEKKLYKLADVIHRIGFEKTRKPPTIIGVAEVENKEVLQDLINEEGLKDYNYSVIHYDSKDERGIDVGFLYRNDEFKVKESRRFSIYIEKEPGVQDFTRDILLVSGWLGKEMIHCIINHWPSRRDGVYESSKNRMKASNKVIEIIRTLRNNYEEPNIVVMGDFNDNPNDESLKNLAEKGNLYNPMRALMSFSRGTQNHNFKWNTFDQILVSTNFFKTNNTLAFDEANIFDEKFLTQYRGRYKGQPFRTYVGKKYKGGYSDHFPVYLHLVKLF